jgi:hypothetical protein
MGLFSSLFGGQKDASPAQPAPVVPAPARSASGVETDGYGRPMAPDRPVDWPVDEETGQVFDDEWLMSGVKAALNANQFNQMAQSRAESAQRRRARLWAPGVDGVYTEEAEQLRGRHWLEWRDHVEQMNREGRHEAALALCYEIIDVAERVDPKRTAPPGWYDKAGILLRKMKDYDAEVRLMERVVAKYPGDRFQVRLAKARELQAKDPTSEVNAE